MWGENASFEIDNNPQPHEANYLKLDCSKVKAELNWFPKWNIETALKTIVDWNKAYLKGENIRKVTINQIEQYFE
jgi:CDP-glucose 4,6-dehydratase